VTEKLIPQEPLAPKIADGVEAAGAPRQRAGSGGVGRWRAVRAGAGGGGLGVGDDA
jgi:hypothetical protein